MTSLTFWWKVTSSVLSSEPLAFSSAAEGGLGTRTVTRTLASVLPPSPLATRWKLVELEGETVCVPLTGTGPMPSMTTLVALVVRQLRTRDWPISMARGSAVRVAVGAGRLLEAVSLALAPVVLSGLLWWQPVARLSAAASRAHFHGFD